MDILQVLKALGDETRIRILNLLSQGELCVCELERLLDINQSNASRHLNKLTVTGLIAYEKRALYVYYKINSKVLNEYSFLNELISAEFNKLEKCRADIKKLEEYIKSGLSCEDLKEGKVCFTCVKED